MDKIECFRWFCKTNHSHSHSGWEFRITKTCSLWLVKKSQFIGPYGKTTTKIFSSWFFATVRNGLRGASGYAGDELCRKIDFATTTFVFGMEVVVILLGNFTS